MPNCRCLSKRCGAGRENARSIYFHSNTLLKRGDLHKTKFLSNQKGKKGLTQKLVLDKLWDVWCQFFVVEKYISEWVCSRLCSYRNFWALGAKIFAPISLTGAGCFSSLFNFFKPSSMYLPRGETNEQSFQYWSRRNSYSCSCRNAI